MVLKGAYHIRANLVGEIHLQRLWIYSRTSLIDNMANTHLVRMLVLQWV